MSIRVRPRFFDHVGHDTMYDASSHGRLYRDVHDLVEISIFSLNLVTVRLTKIMNKADKNWA